jgi:hypothetical protein
MLKASETGLLDAKELADARKMMSEDEYAQEYECSFEAAVAGAYYGKEMNDAEADDPISDYVRALRPGSGPYRVGFGRCGFDGHLVRPDHGRETRSSTFSRARASGSTGM